MTQTFLVKLMCHYQVNAGIIRLRLFTTGGYAQ